MTQITLTAWELNRLALHAAGNSLTYAGHFAKGGNWTDAELAEGNRWHVLAVKLAGETPVEWTADDFPECLNFTRKAA